MNEKLHLKIEGMHCESCEKIITAELSEIAGIADIKINAVDGSGELSAPEEVSSETITQAITRAGYIGVVVSRTREQMPQTTLDAFEKKIVSPMIGAQEAVIAKAGMTPSEKKENQVYLALSGMHCSSCAGLIERGLKKVSGVSAVNVNFA